MACHEIMVYLLVHSIFTVSLKFNRYEFYCFPVEVISVCLKKNVVGLIS